MAALVIMTDFIPRFGLGHGIFNSLFLAVSLPFVMLDLIT